MTKAVTEQQLENVRIHAKIIAIESMLASILTALVQTPAARESLRVLLDQMAQTGSEIRFPGLSAEHSDLLAAETQEAFSSLVSYLKKRLQM